MQEQIRQFRILIERDGDGLFVASAPELPGCHTQGKTYEEVMVRMREAVELYIEILRDKQKLDTVLAESPSRFFAIEDVRVRV